MEKLADFPMIFDASRGRGITGPEGFPTNASLPYMLKIEIKNNQSSSNVKKRPSKLDKFIDIEQRVFNEEIYLFDHPYFGVLVSIIKV